MTEDLIEKDILACYDFLAHEKQTELRFLNPNNPNEPARSLFVATKEEFLQFSQINNGQCNVYAGINERNYTGTKKEDVLSVKTIVIDIDAIKPKGEAATEEELKKAELVADKIIFWFSEMGFCQPSKCMSGNGYQLWCAISKIGIDGVNRDSIENQIKAFYKLLIKNFSGQGAQIDNIGDLPRIIKVIGTKSIKGIETKDRPYRTSFACGEYKRQEDEKLKAFILQLDTEEFKPKEPTKKAEDKWLTIEAAMQADKKLTDLYLGNLNAQYLSRSEAELALLCKLVWWAFSETEIRQIMKKSRIGKWNDKQTTEHYQDWQIKKAYGFITETRQIQKDYPEEEIESKIKQELQIKQVPTLSFINFSEFEPIFESTHKHLQAFDLIDNELGLIGKEYYPIKKHLCYDVESQRQTTISFQVGRDYFDNRVHNIISAGGGRGKGQIKHISKMAVSQAEISAARTNLEQLVGKRRKEKKIEIEDRSIFGEKKLLVDEAQSLLCEEDKGAAAIMHDFRIAMDTYGFNQVEKKQVDVSWLRYCPETRVSLFIHDVILPPIFFDLGTFRRCFAFELKPQKVGEDAAIKNLYAENRTNEMKEYITSPALEITNLIFEKEAIDIIVKAIRVWNRFALQHPNQRIRAIAKQGFFSIKQYFFRIVAVLAIANMQNKVSKKIAELGCFDCIQFLLETYKIYANKSTVVLSRDIWKTDDPKAAMFFEWLHYNSAINQEATPVSIYEAQEQIQDTFGVNDRQARSIFQKMKKEGYIDSTQGYQESKVWLAFEPNLEGFVEFSADSLPDLKTYLLSIKQAYFEKEGGNGGNQEGISNIRYGGNGGSPNPLYIHAESSSSLSSSVIIKKDIPKNTATIATMELPPLPPCCDICKKPCQERTGIRKGGTVLMVCPDCEKQ